MTELFVLPAMMLGLYCPPDVNNCDIYDCVHAHLQCDANNDLLKFSQFYCQKFIDLNDQFSPQTQAVLAEIRYCLQYELTQSNDLTCTNVRKTVSHHHEQCYLNSGFCDLPFSQKWKIFKQIKATLKEPEYRKTFRVILSGCML